MGATDMTDSCGKADRRANFAEELRRLRASAGNPSFRAMAAKSGTVSHTTLHEAAVGTRFPSWATTTAFVEACGGDEAEWRQRWDSARSPEQPEPATPAPPVVAGPPPAATENRPSRATRRRGVWIAIGTVLPLVLVVPLAMTVLRGRNQGPSATPPPATGTLVPGDTSQFVADITIPDGTTVKVGQRFTKVWEIKDSGTVAWHGRYLRRANLPADNGACVTPPEVPVPDTAPGTDVMVSVPVVAPTSPGTCWAGWKMVDDRGNYLFPGSRPVYFVVTVAN
jgi:hypothetical protein